MKAIVVGFSIMVASLAGLAQGNLTEIIQQPVFAQHLDGTISLQGAPDTHISDVRVEECDAGWKHVLNSTITDENGHFHLKPAVAGSKHYLRLTAKNYNLRLYTVILSSHSPAELNLQITPGT